MHFNDLKLFIHLAQTQHFAQTAIQNHMSASTLSRRIQTMEEELGKVLFLRDNRQVTLTYSGQQFLTFAQTHWQQWQQFKQQLSCKDLENLTGELRLFCSVTAAYSHLPPLLEKFRLRYPKVEIQLITGDPALAVQSVQSNQVDLALAGKPQALPSGIEFHHIDDISFTLIAPRVACIATQELQKKPVNWEQVPFILPVEGPARREIDRWFKQQKIKHPKIYATVAGHEGLVPMVALGFGVAMIPTVVLKNGPMSHQILTIELDSPVATFELGVCVKQEALDQPVIKAFWTLLSN